MNDIPEPAAAPAVDDDLLRNLHRAAGVGSAWSTKPEEWAARLLASEPVQRLRAAWINAERKAADANWNREVKRVERERDEAFRQKTEWQATAGRLAAERDTLKVKVEVLQIEGDEARAAQQLPDVGPVVRDYADRLLVDGVTFMDYEDLEAVEQKHLKQLARIRAARAFLDAEAADTSSDDEVRTLAVDLYDVGLHTVGPDELDNRQLAERLLKLGWHRARGGQEAGQ